LGGFAELTRVVDDERGRGRGDGGHRQVQRLGRAAEWRAAVAGKSTLGAVAPAARRRFSRRAGKRRDLWAVEAYRVAVEHGGRGCDVRGSAVMRGCGFTTRPSSRGLTRTKVPALATTRSRGVAGSGQRAPWPRSGASRRGNMDAGESGVAAAGARWRGSGQLGAVRRAARVPGEGAGVCAVDVTADATWRSSMAWVGSRSEKLREELGCAARSTAARGS